MARPGPQFKTNERGELVPLNEEGKDLLINMTRPRSEVLASVGLKGESFRESSELGPGWTKVAVRDSRRPGRLAESFMALGMTAEEAVEAAKGLTV